MYGANMWKSSGNIGRLVKVVVYFVCRRTLRRVYDKRYHKCATER